MATRLKAQPPPASLPTLELVPLAQLRPHPENYRAHPEDQLEHLEYSLRHHGVYRNIVIARDGTILAGHGVVEAAQRVGLPAIAAQRMDLDPLEPDAIKILVGDNEIARLAIGDDRALTERLKQLAIADVNGLLGTGFDAQQLAALTFVTRPASEIQDKDAAAQWVGLPEYEEGGSVLKLVISFLTEEDRQQFLELTHLRIDKNAIKGTTWSTRWPWTDYLDTASVRFIEEDQSDADIPLEIPDLYSERRPSDDVPHG
jgi:hypothetical protein